MQVSGIPLPARHEEVFCLLGDCLGSTVEVDRRTASKTNLQVRKIKILLDKIVALPLSMSSWVEDCKFPIWVEEGLEDFQSDLCWFY